METIKQAIKYGVVGLSNTLITMIVIWVMMKLFGCREGLSNLTGYVAGILNSFIWNKQWTFKGSFIPLKLKRHEEVSGYSPVL